MSTVILDLHGSRARDGVDIDAFETFIAHFRSALREYSRASAGSIARKGGRPFAREASASAFRLVDFKTGSGIATLEPSLGTGAGTSDLALDDAGEALAVTMLRQLLAEVDSAEGLPEPVLESLSNARRAMGDDGSFGVTVNGQTRISRVVIDEQCMTRLKPPETDPTDTTVNVTGRLHMIEADLPNRRVGIRAQDGIDWTCTYPDHLHAVVTTLIERLVHVTGSGRRITAATGRLQIERLESIAEHAQDVLFSFETIPLARLHSEQEIEGPQGLGSLVDEEWEDDEESRLFLEATLGITPRS